MLGNVTIHEPGDTVYTIAKGGEIHIFEVREDGDLIAKRQPHPRMNLATGS